MIILYLVLAALACTIIARALLMLSFAELGRKQDLIKHIYKSGTDFQIAIVIPYLDSRKLGPIQDLLKAIERQDYPANRIEVHVVATEDTVVSLPETEDLPQTTKVWTYPALSVPRGKSVSWLIERLLAAGGPTKLFVFLEADDIIRADFLKNVTTRAFDSFAMQGYIALKRPPKGILERVSALSTRIINRIENAGQFHMGLSCKLLNSGWVIRQELLEMLVYKQGRDLDNLEYTSILNANDYHVTWAPNVVVYRDERVELLPMLHDMAHSVLNRIRMTFQYTIPLLVKGTVKLNFNLFNMAWCMMKPPNFVIGLIAVFGMLLSHQSPMFPGSFLFWSIFAVGFFATQLISLAVARCSFQDAIVFLFLTPLVYAAGLALLPVFVAIVLFETLMMGNKRSRGKRMGKRFDETLPAVATLAQNMRNQRLLFHMADELDTVDGLDQEADERELKPYQSTAQQLSRGGSADRGMGNPILSGGIPSESRMEQTKMLPITNGKHTIESLIRVVTDRSGDKGGEFYSIMFEYKGLSFSTQKYPILDQAYYELLSKLQGKGFSIVSCGSCAYFYHPTVGNPYGLANDYGFCLYGKLGKTLNFNTDTVNVVSEACEQHTPMKHREGVVKQWQDSVESSFSSEHMSSTGS